MCGCGVTICCFAKTFSNTFKMMFRNLEKSYRKLKLKRQRCIRRSSFGIQKWFWNGYYVYSLYVIYFERIFGIWGCGVVSIVGVCCSFRFFGFGIGLGYFRLFLFFYIHLMVDEIEFTWWRQQASSKLVWNMILVVQVADQEHDPKLMKPKHQGHGTRRTLLCSSSFP